MDPEPKRPRLEDGVASKEEVKPEVDVKPEGAVQAPATDQTTSAPADGPQADARMWWFEWWCDACHAEAEAPCAVRHPAALVDPACEVELFARLERAQQEMREKLLDKESLESGFLLHARFEGCSKFNKFKPKHLIWNHSIMTIALAIEIPLMHVFEEKLCDALFDLRLHWNASKSCFSGYCDLGEIAPFFPPQPEDAWLERGAVIFSGGRVTIHTMRFYPNSDSDAILVGYVTEGTFGSLQIHGCDCSSPSNWRNCSVCRRKMVITVTEATIAP